MKFSIIIPSYNQEKYIGETLENLSVLKQKASLQHIEIEVLLFDSESTNNVPTIINQYKHIIDYIEIKKDLGQYDAINKGIKKVTGDYWTWLNTDDLINIEGFLKLAEVLKQAPNTDYIYGSIDYIDSNSKPIKTYVSYVLNYKTLYSQTPAVFQPGSFFKTSFTNKIGELAPYKCCFDYEYILRFFKNKAQIYCCDFSVAQFRYYNESKTGSIIPVFIKEQLLISKLYGRKWYHFLTIFSYARLLKHKLFPRK